MCQGGKFKRIRAFLTGRNFVELSKDFFEAPSGDGSGRDKRMTKRKKCAILFSYLYAGNAMHCFFRPETFIGKETVYGAEDLQNPLVYGVSPH